MIKVVDGHVTASTLTTPYISIIMDKTSTFQIRQPVCGTAKNDTEPGN
jgi:hypothetical protein